MESKGTMSTETQTANETLPSPHVCERELAFDGGSCLHPLQNPLILSHMFNLCPPKLLLNFRRVCKQWYELSLGPWRSSVTLIFTQDESVIKIENCPRNWLSFPSYVEFYHDNPEYQTDTKPFRHLRLRHWSYDSSLKQLRYFWTIFGNNVTTLELTNGCSFSDVEELRRVLYKYCPNLKHLHMLRFWFREIPSSENFKEVEYQEPAYGEHMHLKSFRFENVLYTWSPKKDGVHKLPLSWHELLSHFQSLTSISYSMKLGYFPPLALIEVEHDCTRLLEVIRVIRRHDRRKLPLTSFSFLPFLEVTPTRQNLNLHKELHLPLKSGALRLHLQPGMEEQFIEDFMKMYMESLTGLQLVPKYKQDSPLHFDFPDGLHLDNLTSVQLSHVMCDHLDFLKGIPNLQKLEITDSQFYVYSYTTPPSYTGIDMVSNTKLGNTKLLKLKQFICGYILSDMDIRSLVEWMPNIEKLEMVLNDKQFEIVCQHWRNLKGLKVLGKYLTDEGVTGWRFDKIEKNGSAVRPNITYLQSLIFCSFYADLTDASVFQGFIHLANLKRLQICPRPPFGLEAQSALSQRNINLMGIGGDVTGDD